MKHYDQLVASGLATGERERERHTKREERAMEGGGCAGDLDPPPQRFSGAAAASARQQEAGELPPSCVAIA